MKRILTFILVAAMLAVPFALTASAENFVPSITVKPAPDVEHIETDGDGKYIIGYIVDPDGNIIATVYEDCIVITSVDEAEDTDKIPKESADLLIDVYEKISDKDYDLSDLSEELNKLVKDTLGEDYDAESLVIKDLFDITGLCDDIKTHLPVDGNVITLKLSTPVDKSTPIFVMTYIDGKWAPVEKVVNNGDGTIDVTFEDFCPVAVLVPQEGYADTPQTGDNSNNIIWGIVMVVCVVGVCVLVAYSRRSGRKHELD